MVKVDGYSLIIPTGSFVQKRSGKNIFYYHDKEDGVKMTLNIEKNTWQLSVAELKYEQINLSDGLDVYLSIGGYEAGAKLDIEYKSNYRH